MIGNSDPTPNFDFSQGERKLTKNQGMTDFVNDVLESVAWERGEEPGVTIRTVEGQLEDGEAIISQTRREGDLGIDNTIYLRNWLWNGLSPRNLDPDDYDLRWSSETRTLSIDPEFTSHVSEYLKIGYALKDQLMADGETS